MHFPEDKGPEDTEEAARLRREAAAKLPEELRFIFDLPDVNRLSAEELEEFSLGYLKKLRTHRDQLIAQRIDADKMIAQTEAITQKLSPANARVEDLEERFLQATADSAEAQFKLFKVIESTLKAASKANPFHPKIQELQARLEEWRKHMPKEE